MEKLEKENEDEMGQAELCIPSQTDLFQVRIWQIPVLSLVCAMQNCQWHKGRIADLDAVPGFWWRKLNNFYSGSFLF